MFSSSFYSFAFSSFISFNKPITEITLGASNTSTFTVNSCRERILRFNSEIISGNQKHNKEYYDEILSDIDKYEHYCLKHAKYPNNKAMLSIENIKKTYADLLERNDFYEK